jgi:hypothetical protein
MACGNEGRFDLMLGIAASTCARNVATIFFFFPRVDFRAKALAFKVSHYQIWKRGP